MNTTLMHCARVVALATLTGLFVHTGAVFAQQNDESGVQQDATVDYALDVHYDVPVIGQPTTNTCWAAGGAMVVSWHNQTTITPEQVANNSGLGSTYHGNSGLPPNDQRMFQHYGMIQEAPQCYTVDGLYALLYHYGPLWVALDAPGAHIVVIKGMYGDGSPDGTYLEINDPDPVGSGSSYTESFTDFTRRQESLGLHEMQIPGAIYVAHFPRPSNH